MAIGAGGASIAGAGIQAGAAIVAEGIFGGPARGAAKALSDAQKRLVNAQIEEQTIRNQILKSSLTASDAALPTSQVRPGARPIGAGVIPDGAAGQDVAANAAHAPTLAGLNTTALVVTIGAGLVAVLAYFKRAR